MESKIKDGNLVINLHDLLSHIEVDELDDLYESLQWHSPTYRKLIESARTIYCARSYNSDFFEFFKAILLMPAEYEWEHKEDIILEQMSKSIRSILEENSKLYAELAIHDKIRGSLYTWLHETYGHDVAYKAHSKMIDLANNFEGKKSYELAKEMSDIVDTKSLAESWLKRLYEIFGEQDAEDNKLIS